MSTTREQRRVTLPDSLMAVLRAAAASDETTPAQIMEAGALMAFGYGLFDAATDGAMFDPTSVAIPVEQSKEVMALLIAKQKGDTLGGVNWSLAWMNSGPSAWEPETTDPRMA